MAEGNVSLGIIVDKQWEWERNKYIDLQATFGAAIRLFFRVVLHARDEEGFLVYLTSD